MGVGDRHRYVSFHDPEIERLARQLLGGKRPTPPRVHELLLELSERRFAERRKESTMPARPRSEDRDPLAEREAEIAREALGLPPEPPEPEREPTSGIVLDAGTEAESVLHNAPDAVQKDAIQELVGQYRDFDAKRREKILRQPLGALRRSSRIETLTEACRILTGELEDSQRDRVAEVARENGWPEWVVVLGAVARAADLQELMAGDFKPDWLSQSERSEKAAVGEYKCQLCGGVIPNARRNQAFCCSRHGSGQDAHNDGCGLAHLQKINGSWVDSRKL